MNSLERVRVPHTSPARRAASSGRQRPRVSRRAAIGSFRRIFSASSYSGRRRLARGRSNRPVPPRRRLPGPVFAGRVTRSGRGWGGDPSACSSATFRALEPVTSGAREVHKWLATLGLGRFRPLGPGRRSQKGWRVATARPIYARMACVRVDASRGPGRPCDVAQKVSPQTSRLLETGRGGITITC